MLDNYPSDLRAQVHEDLTMRARGGTFVYLIAWLVSSIWAGIPASHPVPFYLNTLIFFITSLLRLAHYISVKKDPLYKVGLMSKVLIFLVLFGGLHWGILSAWIFFNEFSTLLYPYLVMLAAFAIGGSTTLSISREIRILYPLLMFLPGILQGALFDRNSESMLYSLLAVLAYLYVLEASRGASKDYYTAIINGRIAAERARLMEQQSNTDPLTLLKNRLYFNRRFTEEWVRSSRLKVPLSILMLDIDYFKNINDKYGHIVGDECLQAVARTLEDQLPRGTDTIARYGGEEFVILLTNTKSDMAKKIARRLVLAVSEISLLKDEQDISLSCSVGVATVIPDHQSRQELLLIAADAAMYQAKDNGRNQWAVADWGDV